MPNIGPMEIVILVVILLLVFGSKRLPEMGKSLGKGMREFKDSVSGKDDDPDSLPAEPDAEPAEIVARAVEEDEQPVVAGSDKRDS
jgi:sec-independent protein translocase protein TatA